MAQQGEMHIGITLEKKWEWKISLGRFSASVADDILFFVSLISRIW